MRFHSHSPSNWGLLLLFQVSSLLFAACAEDAPRWSGAGTFARLELSPTSRPIESPELKVLGRWDDFKSAKHHEEWTVRGTTPRIREYQGQEILRFARQNDVLIEIPIDAAISQRCMVDVLSVVRGENIQFSVAVFSGEERIGTQQVKVDPGPNLQGIPFQIRLKGDKVRTATKIALHVPKGVHSILIRSIVFRQGALGMELGSNAFGDYSLVEIEGEARRSTALPSDAGLRASFEVKSDADVLCFSYAQNDELRLEDQDATLHLTLKSGQEESVFEFDFDRDRKGKLRWNHAEVSLRDWVGSEVSASWTLESQDGLAMCVIGQPRLSTLGAPSKTVLLVTSDTHRSDHLGFLMDDGELQTDAIDRLAAEGVVFLDAISSVNNTTPSHVSLFTGLSPRDTGIVANAKRLSDAAPTLAEAYRDAGYMTLAAVSATPVDYKLCGLGQGFDRYSIPVGKGVRGSAGTLDVLLEWLAQYDGSPVFMWLHIYDAHGPYDPPDDLKWMYYDENKDPFDVDAPDADLGLSPYWDKKIADPAYTEALYKSEITYLDRRLGDLLELERVRNGVIAFTSDHGEVMRYGPDDPFDHRGLSLGTLAVPMIFKAPDLQGGMRRDDPVLQIDVGRTLLNLSGFPDVEFPGRDVLATSLDPGEPRFAIEANGISASVLTDKWMFAINLRIPGSIQEDRDDFYHAVELFDIVNDKSCRYNVWEENPEKAAVLRRAVIRWLEKSQNNAWESAPVATNRDIAKEMADLGYVTVEDSSSSEWFDSTCDCSWCLKFAE